jgi:aryl-alcohol dehydrogenase-like predicted oxidoreductase
VRRLETIAAEKQCSPAQLALAWLLAKGEDIAPIVGTKRTTYLSENLGAMNVVLSPEDLEHIEAAAPAGAAKGLRYPELAMKMIDGQKG